MPSPPRSDPAQIVQGAPVLHVRDVKGTAAWYRDVLGFQWDFGDEGYSVVWRDNAAVHLAAADADPIGVHLFLWVRDADSCHRELLERGARVVVELADRPYGIRDFTVRDPNGVDVVLGQDLQP